MHYTLTSTEAANEVADCLIVAIFDGMKLSQAADALDQASEGYIRRLLATQDLVAELGKTLLLYSVPGISAARVLLVYCGEEEKFQLPDFRKVVCCVATKIKSMRLDRVCNYLCYDRASDLDFYDRVRQTIELNEDCLYTFDQLKTKKTDTPIYVPPKEYAFFNLLGSAKSSQIEKVIKQAVAITAGIKLTKDLANLPANICTPVYMAEQAKNLAKEAGLSITVLEKEAIEKEGMDAFLAVAQGSQQPPRFVILIYQGAEKKQKPVVLVGKGVTFDSGGICLKPAVSMEEMKFDMAGAASVLGTFKTITTLKLPINVVGLMPLTENLPSGSAVKPGDVVKSFSGQTIEVINTDAEGRLILADALSYSERFNPALVIDMATLTGAIITALGAVATGLMGNSEELIQEIEKAGRDSYDRVWPLPLWDDYQEQIDSNVADISNIGVGGGKSITAACFLSRFTKKVRWAHLDIAGTAWKSGKDKMATGRPVSLLVQFLLNRCP
jgi:leucyl aminopeptidase